jgi:hypothetical protein
MVATQTNPPTQRGTPWFTWLLIAVSAVIAVSWFFAARGYWEDDAYIHLEFARSLAAGRGFMFNGHVVYGDTSPLWVWLLAAFHLVIPDWMTAGKALTVFAAAFSLSGVFTFALTLVRHRLGRPAALSFAATMLLGFVLSPYFGYWAYSGMEALAAAGLVCWTCVLIAPRHLSWQRILLAAFCAGLAPLLRPELTFFTLLLFGVLFLRIRDMHHASLVVRTDVLVAALVLIAVPAVAWGFYAVHAFGRVLPNTNAAKRAGPGESILIRLTHVYGFGYPITGLVCILLVGWLLHYAFSGREKNARHSPWSVLNAGGWLLFVWTGINCLFYLANHTLVQTRYIFVSAPVLTIAVFAFAAMQWPRAYPWLVAIMLIYGAAISLVSTRQLVRNKVADDVVYAELAAYMRTLPPDAPVALYPIGEPAFLSEHPVVDTGGITRPGVIPFIHDESDDRVTAWIYGEGARYEVIDHAPIPGAQLVWSRDLPAASWFYDMRRYLATDRLQVWKLTIPLLDRSRQADEKSW